MEYERLLTFDDFLNLVKNHRENIEAFYDHYVVFYEAGAWGLGYCKYGFKTPKDLQRYRDWLRR